MSVLAEIEKIEWLPKATTKKTGKKMPFLNKENFDAFIESYGLDKSQANLVRLVHLDGCTFSQIAKQIGCSRQNVHQAYNTIYKKVMRELTQQ